MIREGALVLADGSIFEGELFGAERPVATGEVVFNTVLSGYQEVITDPSYAGQIITFTTPHIGNYGTNAADFESRGTFCRGIVVRALARRHSNHRAESGLDAMLRQHGVPGIAGIDTRRLTRILRDTGSMPAAFGSIPPADLAAAANAEPGTDGIDLVGQVTIDAGYTVEALDPDNATRIVAIDYGMKRNIAVHLSRFGTVEVVPASTSAADILARRPNGVFLSNGPGDPAMVPYAVDTIGGLVGNVADLRDLPRPPTPRSGDRRRHREAPVRAPRGQPSGEESRLRAHRDHEPEPQLRGRSGLAGGQGHHDPRQPQRWCLRGTSGRRRTRLQRAAPSRGQPRPARLAVPVRPVRRHDASCRCADGEPLMPKRTDIHSILIIGSGPIVIGQACEFDYSGTQACRVLREEGYRVILANSNPATIMTDPDFADATYIEPLTWEVVSAIIDREQPDAVLPTLGGQTGLNIAMELFDRGLIGVPGTPEMIGANAEAIATAEDRELFKQAMVGIGLDCLRSGTAHTMDEARVVVADIGLPAVIRPAYILGGRGTGIASTPEEFERIASNGLTASPISEILIEESVYGWKEFELEVMRDHADNCVIICGIENVDPMGVHTGDSITVAPIQTLTDVEYQEMRNSALACIRRVGVETGGSNVQFAVEPNTGRQVVIEMNPRVSRSSALASKATGFPIAKIAARLAVGYTLDEIPNDITQTAERSTPASFEPVIDYVVTKIPRWAFEKLPGTTGVLGTQMQSVGEVMAIGRTFPESLQKALRSLEQGRLGLGCDPASAHLDELTDEELLAQAAIPTADRIQQVGELLNRGVPIDTVNASTRIDPWFLDQMSMIVEERADLAATGFDAMTTRSWRRAKRLGFSDGQLAHLWELTEDEVRTARERAGVIPTYKTVDTCSAEFVAETPYHYSTYEDESEIRSSTGRKVVILGSGPNRIGQGIEFDYCCVHASFALREAGFETIMINCNPETVSTDYDTSDRLYFEPLTQEDVLNVIAAERPEAVIVSLGGQTPLKLSGLIPVELVAGTSPDSIDAAEDRERWNAICDELRIPQPPGGTAVDLEQALAITDDIGFPVLVRPSYVLGGRAMQIVHDRQPPGAGHGRIGRFRQFGQGGRPVRRAAGADRSIPRRRHRGRRRRDPRPHRRSTDRRRHGARRGSRRALRGLCVCHPATDPAVVGGRGHRVVHGRHRQATRRSWPDQRPVRRDRHDGVRDRGQPSSESDGAVRRQGDGCPARQGRHTSDAGRNAGRTPRRGTPAATGRRSCCRQGGRPAVQPVPRGRPGTRTRDALDR